MSNENRNTDIVTKAPRFASETHPSLQYLLIISILFFLSVFNLFSGPCLVHAAENEKKPALQFSRNHDISQIKPRKPVKIKLHRSAKGEYQWDITGDNADDIVKADSRLRKLLGEDK